MKTVPKTDTVTSILQFNIIIDESMELSNKFEIIPFAEQYFTLIEAMNIDTLEVILKFRIV